MTPVEWRWANALCPKAAINPPILAEIGIIYQPYEFLKGLNESWNKHKQRITKGMV